MRPIERIDNFLEKVNWANLIEERWNLPAPTSGEDSIVNNILGYSNYTAFENYWKENPDQRVGQVLINLGLVPDNLRIWSDEEEDILISQGVPPEECVYWTSIYDRENNLLSAPVTRLIKDLDISHILNIKRYAYNKQVSLPHNVLQAFENILNSI